MTGMQTVTRILLPWLFNISAEIQEPGYVVFPTKIHDNG